MDIFHASPTFGGYDGGSATITNSGGGTSFDGGFVEWILPAARFCCGGRWNLLGIFVSLTTLLAFGFVVMIRVLFDNFLFVF